MKFLSGEYSTFQDIPEDGDGYTYELVTFACGCTVERFTNMGEPPCDAIMDNSHETVYGWEWMQACSEHSELYHRPLTAVLQ